MVKHMVEEEEREKVGRDMNNFTNNFTGTYENKPSVVQIPLKLLHCSKILYTNVRDKNITAGIFNSFSVNNRQLFIKYFSFFYILKE